MKRIIGFGLGAAVLMALTGCTSMSSQEDRQVRAAATCIDKTDEAARKVCMDTELAAMTALERQEQSERKQAEADRDRREAIRQAYGVPKRAARETYDNGLGLPGGRN